MGSSKVGRDGEQFAAQATYLRQGIAEQDELAEEGGRETDVGVERENPVGVRACGDGLILGGGKTQVVAVVEDAKAFAGC